MIASKRLIVGNWKMNLTVNEASLFAHRLNDMIELRRDVEVVIAPTALCLQPLSLQVDHRKIKLAAQNLYWRDNGAFTGEISANQLRGIVSYAIIGHSERRHIFGETDKEIRNKVQAAVRNRIKPILCIGETAAERAAGETHGILHDQITAGLSNITSDEVDSVAIAYEPVWAIGTGDSALPRDIQTAAKAIRSQVKHLFGEAASQKIRILYGGSVNIDNASDYLNTPGVDGLLIGGASLRTKEFSTIINKAHVDSVRGETNKG